MKRRFRTSFSAAQRARGTSTTNKHGGKVGPFSDGTSGTAFSLMLLLIATVTAWTVHPPPSKELRHHRRGVIFTSRSLLLAADLHSYDSPDSMLLGGENDDDDNDESLITTGLLKVSYDGASFSGWTVGDDNNFLSVRSVRGVLQSKLSKLYGNVDPSRIIVEGCSRTDKGVHAIGMVAQFYCLTGNCRTNNAEECATATAQLGWLYPPGQPSIPGKRTPHPRNATDTSCFVPLSHRRRRQQGTLAQLAYALNRMCPEDVQIMAYACIPSANKRGLPFHPTVSAHRKTYRYHFSVGVLHDPTQIHKAWHIGNYDDNMFDCSLIHQACASLEGRHNFTAFRGAPRGSDDKRKYLNQDPFCTLEHVLLYHRQVDSWLVGALTHDSAPTRPMTTTYTLEITGDRFLYKMVRFLVGALVAVGRKEMSLTELERLLTTGDRRGFSWKCAPAHGLQLYDVHYFDSSIDWQTASR